MICRIKNKNVDVNYSVVQNYFQSQIDKNQENCTRHVLIQFSVGVSQFSSGVVLQYRSVLFLVAFISLLYCSFVFLVFFSALLDRVLDAVLQWRFSSFPVVDLYLLLFSFVSALPGKIASCKNVMKCDVRMYGARAREPFRLP